MTNILISKPIFGEKIKRLADAFRVNLSKETIAVYYDKIKHCREDDLETAVEYLIESEDFFPAIHKLKESIHPSSTRPQPNEITQEDVARGW